MKSIYILLTILLLSSCSAQQKITAVKNDRGDLVGIANKTSFSQEPYNKWFDKNFKLTKLMKLLLVN